MKPKSLKEKKLQFKSKDLMKSVQEKVGKKVIARLRFEGCHRYKNAPEAVKFLREWHRHEFHVEVEAVERGDREIEFIMLKGRVQEFVNKTYAGKQFEDSCEAIATAILKAFPETFKVRVFEDGENGAEVSRQFIIPIVEWKEGA